MSITSSKVMKVWLRHESRLRAVAITRLIGRRYGKEIGFVYVGGFPKSGTTWVSQLVARALDIPYADQYFLPLSFQTVVHHHWNYHPAFDHSIFVVRDGRDVMVSLYMNLMSGYIAWQKLQNSLASANPVRLWVANVGHRARRDRAFARLFGKTFDPWDVERHLPRFIEAELQRPFLPAVSQPWPVYVCNWLAQKQKTVVVRYEDMLADGPDALEAVISTFTGKEVSNKEDIIRTVQRYSFRRQTGRQPGDENRHSFARKGISGDWKNYFSREARQVFDYFAGDALVALGYEQNRNWVDEDESNSPES